jgi:hypothetical protein
MPVASLNDIATPVPPGVRVASLADIAGPDEKKESYLGGLYASTLGPVVQTAKHPIDTAAGLVKAVIGTRDLDDIAAAVKSGDYKGAALRVGQWATEGPGGRMAHGIVDPVVQNLSQGNYAGAAGRATGSALSLGLPIAAETEAGQAATSAIARGAPDIGVGAAKVAAGTVAGSVIPGGGMLTRLLLDYPGARQIATGIGKVFKSDAPVADKVAAAAKAAEAEAADPLLDAIAQGQGYPKGFKSVPAQGQAIVRNLAQAMRQSEAAKTARPASASPAAAPETLSAVRPEAPATPNYGHLMDSPENQPVPDAAERGVSYSAPQWMPGPSGTPEPWEPPAGAPADVRNFTPEFGTIAEQLRDAMLKNGTITAEHLKPPVPVESDSINTEALADTMRGLPPASRVATAKANYAGNPDDSELAGAVYEAAHRADRAGKLAASLRQQGVTSDEIGDIASEHWEKLAKAVGINPPSMKTIAETGAQLRQIENHEALIDAVDRLGKSLAAKRDSEQPQMEIQ